MNAYEEELYEDYPNLNNNELPYIIGCLHTEDMEAVQKFFLRGLYKDVKIHQITRWKRNCQPVCVYTVVYKIKDRPPDLGGEEIFIPFPDNEEDLKKMFRHITEMVFGMHVVEKKLSDDGVFASISYAPVRCACNVRNFDMAAEEPRMQPLITEKSVVGKILLENAWKNYKEAHKKYEEGLLREDTFKKSLALADEALMRMEKVLTPILYKCLR